MLLLVLLTDHVLLVQELPQPTVLLDRVLLVFIRGLMLDVLRVILLLVLELNMNQQLVRQLPIVLVLLVLLSLILLHVLAMPLQQLVFKL